MQQANVPTPAFAPAAATALAVLLLTGCAPPGPTEVIYQPMPPQFPAPAQSRPAPQPVVPRVDMGIEDGLPNPANAACMSAVAEQADDFNVRVLGNESVAAGTEVTVGVGENLARWRCVAGPSGEIVEVFPRTSPPQRTGAAPPLTGDAL